MKSDYNKLYKNHYNSCYNDFAKKALEKNNYETYKKFKTEEEKLNYLEKLMSKDPYLLCKFYNMIGIENLIDTECGC